MDSVNLTQEDLWAGLEVFNNNLKDKSYNEQVSAIITAYCKAVLNLQKKLEEMWLDFSNHNKEVTELWEMIYDENLFCGGSVIQKWLEEVEMLQEILNDIRMGMTQCLEKRAKATEKYRFLLRIADQMSK